MEIKFSKEQYENLIKLVYFGNWIINGIRSGAEGDELIEKYEDLEQYIFSFAKEFGLEKYIVFDKRLKRYFPTREFEEDPEVERYRQEYDEETFWEELIERLTCRDFVKEYGGEEIRKMDWRERIDKQLFYEEKYRKEFEENGIENLKITKI